MSNRLPAWQPYWMSFVRPGGGGKRLRSETKGAVRGGRGKPTQNNTPTNSNNEDFSKISAKQNFRHTHKHSLYISDPH
jgi:hypothetical protein